MGDGKAIPVQGLTAREICDHLETYEVLRKISIGGTMTDVQAILWASPALHAWVASACGYHRNKDAELLISENMTIEQSSEIAEVSLSLTFSKGFGPFSGRLTALLAYITEDRGPGPDMRSELLSRHAARQSKTARGTSPLANSPPSDSSTNASDSSTPPTESAPLG